MISFFAIIPATLMLSLTHCIGMCGGFVIAYNAKLASLSRARAFFFSLVYQICRIFAYIMLGALGGAFGSVIVFSDKTAGFMQFCVGILLIIFGVALLKRGVLLKFIENQKIYNLFLAKPMKFALGREDILGFCLLGFLNGLLPCGLVYTYLAMAIMSHDAMQGALVMAVFGLSTLPALLAFGGVANFISAKFSRAMLYISSFIIIIFGIYWAYCGFILTR
ncbi:MULTISPECIES: sulfite exporter TauE/SafE family protein [unclassified Campylobacter]|uniref:sulfite exporter TauE/SafE family protein n=1 Tax=unclassified Campylobacter TaxID=2593542 RepID=UPI0022E9BAFB|nr:MULTISPECIES: sulfite exporter TauE/SafE family protein [unclassified Campylobacter]MDA3054505.1 sulfite exporter TauE/SafE family protein [Campylobacter sp. VBCF_07 NA4]MDA3060711.1 sulfite exporter TauE/SafE family protein [Campylobacter sp. VBCF_02 NA5]MDA3070023.1 sulfite exporter TauE/SafE family protein [Campylobacter sp. VBCF_08 NA3]WBR54461.1 sulfite exporter TauE/SafE family protein [Campylobacter sp. VBCF_01 NA2]